MTKKLLVTYLLLTKFDNYKCDYSGKTTLLLNPIECPSLFNHENENYFLSVLLTMIEFIPNLDLPFHYDLFDHIKKFYYAISNDMNLNIITDQYIFEELYSYVYRQYFLNIFNYKYDDKLVKNTDKEYPFLTNKIKKSIIILENFLDIIFNEEQISSLVLIFSKWITKNKLLLNNRKKIIIVTNISFERVNYFIEQLKLFINYECVAVLNINEIAEIINYEYDLILTFSKRMTNLINKITSNYLQIHFFITNQDLMNLFEVGCELANRRVLVSNLLQEIENKDYEDAKTFLLKKYPEIFL
ncbi:hypothetical protein [Ignavigranum ruoffiae]|uniref:hypothetical protein n=1 Tax=Ignavigranum ruoffiae TaxID=89093 RepID=UPI000B8A00EF|nr:hypothetical protein [Ignavigranum ruoffiae]